LGVEFWLWVGSECIMYAGYGRGAIRGGFERGFLGFVEVFSLLVRANPGNDQRVLTNGARVMPHCGRLGYSVLRNSAMATASIAVPMTATMARHRPTGTTQPNQVMPGLRACTATGLTDKCANTAFRIGWTT